VVKTNSFASAYPSRDLTGGEMKTLFVSYARSSSRSTPSRQAVKMLVKLLLKQSSAIYARSLLPVRTDS
jgi:hypothetical protein